jgi:hypothetical protein
MANQYINEMMPSPSVSKVNNVKTPHYLELAYSSYDTLQCSSLLLQSAVTYLGHSS